MVRLLGASALALIITAPAAQAAYRHQHTAFTGYRHYSVARVAPVRHRVAYRRYWTRFGTARAEAFASRYETTERWGSERNGDFTDHRTIATERWDRARSGGFAEHRSFAMTRVSGGRPRAWCGWYARSLVGSDPGPAYNLARNWTHWGHASSPGVGVMVVWPHHVGMITGRAPDGQWIVKSGNDGRAVRERARSLAGAIAFRSS